MRLLPVLIVCLLSTAAHAASSPREDALLNGYFAILDDNRNVTPATIARLYARQVVYYGHVMNPSELLRDKLNFIRRWPDRHYRIVPGSATRTCDATEDHCELTAVLVWTTRGSVDARTGRSRIRLTLAREDGTLKIVRESAVTLG